MKNPLVSIIIPTYNRGTVISKTLDSLLAQTYRNWECVVVDDGSTDNTFELLASYQQRDSRFRFFKRHRDPKGAPTCRNIGMNQCNGDHIIYLDSDDYLLPFCLEQRIMIINEFPDHDFLVFPMGELRIDKPIKKEIPKHDDHLIPFLSANLSWSIMCPIWRRPFLISLGGFSENYKRFNDPELTIRAFLMPNVLYKVMCDLPYDCVLVPSPKDESTFHKNVYRGLQQFIPDVTKILFSKVMGNKVGYLIMYLRLWLKYYYAPQPKDKFWNSVDLIALFYRENIISFKKMMELNLRLGHFHLGYLLGLKSNDKLTNKAYFLAKTNR